MPIIKSDHIKVKMAIHNWEEAFLQKDIGDLILQYLDVESGLSCRLVCKSWRVVVNRNRDLWSRYVLLRGSLSWYF